jgi:hypothetical protein
LLRPLFQRDAHENASLLRGIPESNLALKKELFARQTAEAPVIKKNFDRNKECIVPHETTRDESHLDLFEAIALAFAK